MPAKTATKPEPTILDKIADFVERFLVFPDPDASRIIALWALHTWTFMESFPRTPWVTPYLNVFSETPGAGKSTLIRVLRGLVYNPEVAGDITSAAMFTLIEESRPTLFIDEVDTVFNGQGQGNESLRRSMNTGYEHSGYAIRKSGKIAEKFSTFCAKLLAGIRSVNADLPETVQTRSIPILLVKGHPKERYYAFMHGPQAEELAAEIDAWIRENGQEIIDYMPDVIDSMDPRAFEISMPLLQLAHAIGKETEEATRTALIRLLSPPAPKDSPEIAMLRGIREAFDSTGADKLHTETLCDFLGQGWNGKLLSNRLRPFEIGAPTTMGIGGKTLKGYYRHQFVPAWERYLG